MCDKNLRKNWVKRQSSSRPGHFYYFNTKTGERSWAKDGIVTDVVKQSTSSTKSHNLKVLTRPLGKTPAQDRLRRLQHHLAKEHHENLVNSSVFLNLLKSVCPVDKQKASAERQTEKNSSLLSNGPEKSTSAFAATVSNDRSLVNVQQEKPNSLAQACAETKERATFPRPVEIKPLVNKSNQRKKKSNDVSDEIGEKCLKEAPCHTPSTDTEINSELHTKLFKTAFKFTTVVKTPSFNFNSESCCRPISANDRLNHLRNILLKQNNVEEKPSIRKDTAPVRNLSPEICSDDATPMDWEYTIHKEIEKIRSQPPADNNSSTLSYYYDMIRENLLKKLAESNSSQLTIKPESFYIVIDTNVFLRNLSFLKDLTKQSLGDTGRTVLVVPYTVIQELDRLKQRKHEAISTMAVRAIKFLNQKFETHDKSVLGQNASESIRQMLCINSPDDSILNCCLQIREKGPQILLMSNDVNLRNKALINGIKTCTRIELEQETFSRSSRPLS